MIVLVSRDGFVKRTPTDIASTVGGKPGAMVNPGWLRMLREPPYGEHDILILTDMGGLIRFPLGLIRPTGKLSRGTKVVRLEPFENVIDAAIIWENEI